VVTIEDGIETIENYAYSNNPYLSKIIIPTSVTTIGSYAFKNCTNLTEIEFKDYNIMEGNAENLTIGIYAFEGCVNLCSIILPKRLKKINSNAFKNCSKLIQVINYSNSSELKASQDKKTYYVFHLL
jgi:hypothetical protein